MKGRDREGAEGTGRKGRERRFVLGIPETRCDTGFMSPEKVSLPGQDKCGTKTRRFELHSAISSQFRTPSVPLPSIPQIFGSTSLANSTKPCSLLAECHTERRATSSFSAAFPLTATR